MLMRSPLARDRRRPEGFIQPCQATLAKTVPTGPQWLHELKYDGIRMIARKDGERVCLWSRYGRNRTVDFVSIVASLRAVPVDSFVLDGEAVAHCDQGLPDFNRTLTTEGERSACLYAWDVLEVGGEDMRTLPLLRRKTLLAELLTGGPEAIRISEHMDQHGEATFRHACAMRLEGIVSKRADRPYRSGRCPHWLKVKNPAYSRPGLSLA